MRNREVNGVGDIFRKEPMLYFMGAGSILLFIAGVYLEAKNIDVLEFLRDQTGERNSSISPTSIHPNGVHFGPIPISDKFGQPLPTFEVPPTPGGLLNHLVRPQASLKIQNTAMAVLFRRSRQG